MPETLTLTSPIIPTAPSITGYSVRSIYLGRSEGVIRVEVEDNNKHRTTAVYADTVTPPSTVATDLMNALNKANLTTKSLQRRILEQLAADGKLGAGAVSGTPE